jgi:Putative Actinobacterial Holin-X, holin superfamily III
MPGVREERSIGELFGELTQDMTLLVRQEVQLARTELEQKASRIGGALVTVGTGGFVAYVGALAIVAALILLLSDLVGIDPWISALIVGGILAIAGYVMLQGGLRKLKQTDLTPRRTVETLKDDVQWAKEQRP